ncbi:MAG: hypothetical protein MZV70_13580 [Desulfobacterales bacterium]|nr:hypothetical protein [Desulfobacterales bacterium]
MSRFVESTDKGTQRVLRRSRHGRDHDGRLFRVEAISGAGGGGPYCLDSLMGGISSESVFGF